MNQLSRIIKNKNGESFVAFEAVSMFDEHTAYASAFGFNAILRLDMDTEKCEYVTFFPDISPWRDRLFSASVCVDKKIYFAPGSAEYIACYNSENHEVQKITLTFLKQVNRRSKFKFCDIVCFENRIYFIGASYHCIVSLDRRTEKLETIELDIKERFLFRKGIVVGDTYYVPSCVSSIVLEFNMRTEAVTIHTDGNPFGAWTMAYDGENYWMPPRTRGDVVVCWNEKHGCVKQLTIDLPHFEPKDLNFLRVFCTEDKIICIPEKTKCFLSISGKTNEVNVFGSLVLEKNESIGNGFETPDDIYITLIRDDVIVMNYRICKSDGRLAKCDFKMRVGENFIADMKHIFKKMWKGSGELAGFSLEDYLLLI